MSENSFELINEYKEQIRILRQEVAELQDAGKSKDSANKRCLQKLEHTNEDLEKAMSCRSKLIGINNRNLENFSVNIEISLQLKKIIPTTKLVISESGIKNSEDIKLLTDNGIRTFLIGETFMRQDCPGEALKKLLSSCAESD